jgi:[protein-PII] uridylyltransferase
MPHRYGAHFDVAAIGEHAAIVTRRGGFLVHLEIWRRLSDDSVVLCVVADDRPGLLSLISASLVVHDVDITTVKAYTRTVPGTGVLEAVDFLWVRRATANGLRVEEADVAAIGGVLTALVSGKTTVPSILRSNRLSPPPTTGAPTRVTFEGSADEGSDILTVETTDRPGLLLGITQALFRAGAQIVASDAATRDGRVADRFTIVERDGQRMSRARRLLVQTEVLSAIETIVGATSSSSKRKSTRPRDPGESR